MRTVKILGARSTPLLRSMENHRITMTWTRWLTSGFCCGCSFLQAQKNWFWPLLFRDLWEACALKVAFTCTYQWSLRKTKMGLGWNGNIELWVWRNHRAKQEIKNTLMQGNKLCKFIVWSLIVSYCAYDWIDLFSFCV